MNILHIIDAANGGGAEREMAIIADELSQRGNIVHIIHPPGPATTMFQILQSKNTIVVEYPLKQSNIFKTILFLRQYLIVNRIAVVHSHLYFSDFISSVARTFLPVKHYITLHMFILKSKCKNAFRRIQIYAFAFIAMHRATKIFAVTNDLKSHTCRYFFLSPAHIVVSLNGINFNKLQINLQNISDLKKQYTISDNDTVLLNLGILHETKGQQFIVEAFISHLKKYSHLKCFLLGSDGGIKDRLLNMITSNNLENQIFLPGYQNDIASWLAISSIYIHPTLNDALPLSLIEAMYLYKPVIVSDLATLSDLVQHNQTGLVIRKKSSLDIINSVEALLNDTQLYKKISQNGHDFVSEKCTISSVVNTISQYY